MENLIIPPDVYNVIAELANHLRIPKTDVVRRAIYDYQENLRKSDPLIPEKQIEKDGFWTALTIFHQNAERDGVEFFDSDFALLRDASAGREADWL